MAITLTAPFTYAGGFAAGTTANFIIRANASLVDVHVGDEILNNTRGSASARVLLKSVGVSDTTLTLDTAIPGQTTTDSITFTPPIYVDGYKTSGTATSGTATTLTDVSKAWQANEYAPATGSAYVVWIISGSGAGATGDIVSNTATALTVSGFYRANIATKAIEAVTPNKTSVYAVGWNCNDAVAALAANCSWQNAATKRTMICNRGLRVRANAAFADIGRNIEFSTAGTFLSSENGALFQLGRMNSSKAGVEGGYISYERISNAYWADYNMQGLSKLYGTKLIANRVIDGSTSEFRINPQLSPNACDGFHVINSQIDGCRVSQFEQDVFIDTEIIRCGINGKNPPAINSGVVYNESIQTVGVSGASSAGFNGGDHFNLRHKGVVASALWVWLRPIVVYASTLPSSVAYFWNASFGAYTSRADVVDWGLATPNNGVIYLGLTVSLSTKSSDGANLAAVAVGVIKSSDGTGQIIVAKQPANANYAPTKARFVVTDASGAYTGPFGSGYGLFIADSKLVHSSRTVSAVTDYTGYSLILTKYGYVQQILARSWSYNNPVAEIAYLNADSFVQATYAAAIAYTGIAMTPASSTIVVSSTRTLQELYDFVKSRIDYEAKTNDTHVVDPFVTTDGINYTLLAGWKMTLGGFVSQGAERISGGTQVFNAVGTYAPVLGTCTLEFTAASGTYDLRAANLSGTMTLVNKGGGSITVQLPVGVPVVNTGPNITVDQSIFVTISAPNLIAGTRVRLFNVTAGVEIDNSVVSGGSGYLFNTAFSGNFTARMEACWQSGLLAKLPIQSFAVVTASGGSFVDTQTDDPIYAAWGIDGSTVTEFSVDYTGHIYINFNDPDGVTQKARLGAWYRYLLTSATGIRYYFGAMDFLSTAAIRINQNVVGLLLNNINPTIPVRFTDVDVRLYRADGSSLIAPGSHSIHNDYSGVPDVVNIGGSALTSAESAKLMGMINPDNTTIAQIAVHTGSIESRLPVALVNGKMDAAVSGVPTAAENAAAINSQTIDGAITRIQQERIVLAALAGKRIGIGTTTEQYMAQDETTPRITLSPDTNGNGTPALNGT